MKARFLVKLREFLMEIVKQPINATTHLYGVIGNPIHHSLSPLMHNAVFEKLKMNSVYMAFQIEAINLALAFEGMRSLGVMGWNITIPFKESSLEFIDEVPEDIDRCVGAINTVVNQSGKLTGYNTDVPGFLFALKEDLGFNPEGKTVLVLGAGGAGRAVLFGLAFSHAEKILIYDSNLERASGLAKTLEIHFPETEIQPLLEPSVVKDEGLDLVVNATFCGMKAADPLVFDLSVIKQKCAVFDLIYNPFQTKLLKLAKDLKLPCANGLGMLASQGALSFGLWTGKKEGVREIMIETLKKCLS